jgi:hypothetical protein
MVVAKTKNNWKPKENENENIENVVEEGDGGWDSFKEIVNE